MQDEDRADFFVAFAALCVTFNREATDPLTEAYWMTCSDLELLEFREAVRRAMLECEFFPKPAELRKLCGNAVTGEHRAIAAWDDALKAVTRYGSWTPVDFSDSLINAAIRNLGGWLTFCGRLTGAEEEKWLRKEFVQTYESFAHGGVNGEVCKALSGLSQATVINGEVVKPIPIRIECDPERVRIAASVQRTHGLKFNAVPRLGEHMRPERYQEPDHVR